MYEGVFCKNLSEGIKVVGFAEDMAVVAVAKHIHEIEAAANEAIWKINSWLETTGLVLIKQKPFL